jgi:SAM-dependent methyltransferase
MRPDAAGEGASAPDESVAAYRARLAAAYATRYAEGSDVWSDEAAMAEVGRLFARWIGPEPKRVLDVGAGRGRDARLFASLGHDVTAIDLVASPPEPAPETPGRLVFVRGDIRDFTPAERFDAVCDNGCYHHETPADKPPYLARLSALMRGAEARLCVSVFAASGERGDLAEMPDGRLRRTYALDELARELDAAGFAVRDHAVVARASPGLAYLAVLALRRGQSP